MLIKNGNYLLEIVETVVLYLMEIFGNISMYQLIVFTNLGY